MILTKKVAVVGIGKISDIYIKNITERFHNLEIIGLFDIVRERAEIAAKAYGINKVYSSFDEVLNDKNVDIVLNLTRPNDHFQVIYSSLKAGKHVYTEKPLTTTYEKGFLLVKEANDRSLYLGVAPDTFLGAGIQTCKKLIDDGVIGDPIGASAQMVCRGWESWHPDPDFYYKAGGGPLMDMGPYYITALIYLLGCVETVTGMAKITFKKRQILNGYRKGEEIDVEVPTWINSILSFKNGAMAGLLTTFDGYFNQESRIELYGKEGTIIVPDPNWFDGPVLLFDKEDNLFKEIPLINTNTTNLRGIGLSEMADAINQSRDFKANAQQALHVLDVIESIEKSYLSGTTVTLHTGLHLDKRNEGVNHE